MQCLQSALEDLVQLVLKAEDVTASDCKAVTSDGVTAGLDANQAEGHADLVPLLLITSLLHLLLLFRNYLDQIFHFFSKILLKSLI